MLVVYISGPYSAVSEERRKENILRARIVGQILLVHGIAPIVPHTMTDGWERIITDKEKFMQMDFEIIRRVDALLFLPGWENSNGCKRELAFAKSIGKPCFFTIGELLAWAKSKGGD